MCRTSKSDILGADKSIRNNQGETADHLFQSAAVGYSDNPMNDVITPNSSGDGSDERIFLEAARSGDLDTVKRLCNTANVNCRDFEGRQSTPLHFAAGYNRVEVVEYLLTMGADVQAKDKVR